MNLRLYFVVVFHLCLSCSVTGQLDVTSFFNEDGTPFHDGFALESIVGPSNQSVFVEYDENCILKGICNYTSDIYPCTTYVFENDKMASENFIGLGWKTYEYDQKERLISTERYTAPLTSSGTGRNRWFVDYDGRDRIIRERNYSEYQGGTGSSSSSKIKSYTFDSIGQLKHVRIEIDVIDRPWIESSSLSNKQFKYDQGLLLETSEVIATEFTDFDNHPDYVMTEYDTLLINQNYLYTDTSISKTVSVFEIYKWVNESKEEILFNLAGDTLKIETFNAKHNGWEKNAEIQFNENQRRVRWISYDNSSIDTTRELIYNDDDLLIESTFYIDDRGPYKRMYEYDGDLNLTAEQIFNFAESEWQLLGSRYWTYNNQGVVELFDDRGDKYTFSYSNCAASISANDVIELSKNISVFPNPITDQFRINFEGLEKCEIERFEFYTLSGVLLETVDAKTENPNLSIKVNVPVGTYLLVGRSALDNKVFSKLVTKL